MIVTFCGHANATFTADETQALRDAIFTILHRYPHSLFYLGDYGSFDRLCNQILREQQRSFPMLRRIFITPYLDPDYAHLQNANQYDEVLYPFESAIHPRYAIAKRNLWMVDHADLVIGYIRYDWGGAAKMREYALRKHKPFINLADLS